MTPIHLYSDSAQIKEIQEISDSCRYVFDYCFAEREKVYEHAGKTLNCRDCAGDTTRRGKQIVIVDQFFPTSQPCSRRRVRWFGINDLSVGERTYPSCGTARERDADAVKQPERGSARARKRGGTYGANANDEAI